MLDTTPKRRWYRLTPDRFLVGLLAAEVLLIFGDRFAWFGLTPRSGWNVLLAVALGGLATLVGLLWFGVSLLLHCRFQFRIWSLFVLTLVVAILCSWFTVKTQQARKQREAVEAIENLHGWVLYDYYLDGDGELVNPAEPPRPAWLRKLLGDDFFSDVIWFACFSDFPDDGLGHLKGLSKLKFCHLDHVQVTDAGLVHLKGLTNLQLLYLRATQVTDSGLEHVEALSNLQELNLSSTKVTDAGLEHLKGLANLQCLDLGFTRVSDAGLVHLKGLTNLQLLQLQATQVTDEGIEKLQQALPNCKIRRYGKTIADYDEEIQLNPESHEAYYNRATAYRMKGQKAKAIEDYTQAIRLKAEFAPAYYYRAVIYRVQGELGKAKADFAKALELGYDRE